MANFRSLDEIILAILDYIRIVQPDADTKPGTVLRDIAVDAPSSELSKLYVELRNIQNLGSFASAQGRNLDLLARNFGIVRRSGSPATGVVTFTTNVLESDIIIPAGTTVTARNGISFRTQADVTMFASRANVYRSNAIRVGTDLELAGITDDFAVEVSVEATSFGTSGNIGKFGVVQTAQADISNVTNISSFSGGSNAENDDALRSRVLGVFAGSNIGTTLGYINTLQSLPGISDVLAVEPGDPLMTRDGTDVEVNANGEKVITSAGTGGKVDLYVLGSILNQFVESYIYKDQSGRNDPTDDSNDFILGQRGVNPLLDYQQKRRLLVGQGTLPFQPVQNVISLSGSLSGPNFVEKFVDSEGQTRGTFELVKDSGDFGGSPFGFDRIKFISNQIEFDDESIAKGVFNGEDALDFSDVNQVRQVRQQINIVNEQPTVSPTDRSILTLKRTPILNVNSVTNVTTGQRYTIVNQNLDGSLGSLNTTGRIQISGGTLPTLNDILQVNYVWNYSFDKTVDYDNLTQNSTIRTTQDSVDWGFSNQVLKEEELVTYTPLDGYQVTVTHPISRLTNVNTVVVENVVSANGKLIVANTVNNIVSVTDSDGKEVFYTSANNGSFSNKEITLPTDSILPNSATATVTYNAVDVFDDTGSFSGNVITLGDDLVSAGDTVFVDYVANVNTLLPTTTLVSLPATGSQNEFIVGGSELGNQPSSNLYSGSTVTRNLRFAPSFLRMDFQGILSTGKVTLKGASWKKIEQIYTVTNNGLTFDLSNAIRAQLGVSNLPSTGYLAYVDSLEKVTLSNNMVSSVDYTYDILNYELNNATYSNGTAFENNSLSSTQVRLEATSNNTTNVPGTGDTIRVVAYWLDTNTTERVTVSSSGIQYSANKYMFVDSLTVDSGFVGLSGNVEGSVTISNFNQPISSANYFASYDYTAPKEGERLTVTFNYNRLLSDALFQVEGVRPVTADVLVKAATERPLDVSVNIVPLPNFTGGLQNLTQNVNDAITSFLTSNGLGTTIDVDDVIVAIRNVVGVDRATITTFNNQGEFGVRQSIVADSNEFFSAGTVTVNSEER